MKLYLAAGYHNGMSRHQKIYRRLTPHAKYAMEHCPNRLESYHYLYKAEKTCNDIRRDGKKVFLDSGAFSAFSLGVDVDIEAYAQFCIDNSDIVDVASVLDAIGDVDGTWRNQTTLEQLGVKCLPCFHYGEPEAALEHYLDNYEYITIGGMVPISSPNLIRWLDRIWPKHILDKDGKPRAKVHGFGLTSPQLMRRYPWHSVDSSSWIQVSSFGALFDKDFGTFHVSAQAPNRKMFNGHFTTFAQPIQDKLVERFEYYGFTLGQLQECYAHRRAYCALQYQLLAEEITQQQQQFRVRQEYLL